MKRVCSEDFIDESLVDKARLSMEERIAWLDAWTEIILQNRTAPCT